MRLSQRTSLLFFTSLSYSPSIPHSLASSSHDQCFACGHAAATPSLGPGGEEGSCGLRGLRGWGGGSSEATSPPLPSPGAVVCFLLTAVIEHAQQQHAKKGRRTAARREVRGSQQQ